MNDHPLGTPLPSPEEVLPHRAPFLFLEAVNSCTDDGVEGDCSFPSSLPFFEGHFPERPLVPGVLLLEAAAQLLAYWALHHHGGRYVLLTGIDRARLRTQVLADQSIQIFAIIERVRAPLVRARLRLMRNEQRVGEATITGYLEPISD